MVHIAQVEHNLAVNRCIHHSKLGPTNWMMRIVWGKAHVSQKALQTNDNAIVLTG